MAENTQNNKAKIKQLEIDMKSAFKEDNFDVVTKLAEEIKSVEPDNRMATRLLEKMDEAKADKKKTENAKKIKQYKEMINKMLKEGNLENIRKLSGELKELDEKSAKKWLQKADDLESDLKRKQNKDKIKLVSKDIKVAFKEGNYDQVEKFCADLKELDPGDKSGEKWIQKAEKAKALELKKANAEKINELEKQIKGDFEEGQYDSAKKYIEELVKVDPESSYAGKILAKIDKITEKNEERDVEEEPAELKDIKLNTTDKKDISEVQKETETEVAVQVAPKAPVIPVAKSVSQTAPVQPVAPAIAPVALQSPMVQPDEDKTLKVSDTAEPVESNSEAEVEKKKNIFSRLFKKKTHVEPESGEAVGLDSTTDADKTDKNSGNVFTRMFKDKNVQEEPSKSIIDTIVAKTSENKDKQEDKKEEKKSIEHGEGIGFLKFSKTFIQFSIVFIALSACFFYVQNIDEENRVLGFIGIEENYASRLHSASETLAEKKVEEQKLLEESSRYEKGYMNRYEETITEIIDSRLNWPDILIKINEVADYIYERNSISKYIQFSNFSFDKENKKVSFSGSLSDPLGKNLAKMVELEEAFRYYPKDPSDPQDKTEPYFLDTNEFTSISKSFDKKTGKFTSRFQLSLSLNPKSDVMEQAIDYAAE